MNYKQDLNELPFIHFSFLLLLNVFSSSDLSANRIDHLPPTAFENSYVRVVL